MKSCHAVLDSSGCQFLIPQHMELELAKLFGPQLVRRFLEIRREIANGADVVANGA